MNKFLFIFTAFCFFSCAKTVYTPAPDQTLPLISKKFQCEVYDLQGWFSAYGTKLPDYDTLTPLGTVEADDLHYFNQNYLSGFDEVHAKYPQLTENYGLSCRYKLKSVYSGTTRFYLTSDDGAKLYVNGVLVINADSLHSPQTDLGDVNLGIGTYELRVDYYQGPATQVALALEFSNPLFPRQLVK